MTSLKLCQFYFILSTVVQYRLVLCVTLAQMCMYVDFSCRLSPMNPVSFLLEPCTSYCSGTELISLSFLPLLQTVRICGHFKTCDILQTGFPSTTVPGSDSSPVIIPTNHRKSCPPYCTHTCILFHAADPNHEM